MTKEAIFRGVIRFVFLFAYGAFLYASIRHVATFFHNFEPDATDWNGSYTLAISIDLTALVLTVGVMFFRTSMPGLALFVIWFFIVALTAFSWLVNWEYAMRYQSTDPCHHCPGNDSQSGSDHLRLLGWRVPRHPSSAYR